MFEEIRNPHEQDHYDRICSFFDPSVIALILSNTALDYEERLKTGLDRDFTPLNQTKYRERLSGQLSKALESFRITGDIILYIDRNNGSSVKTYPTTGNETDNCIVISEELISRLDDVELLFILGHEVCHIAFQHAVISWIIETVYPEGQPMPPVIENEWNLWIRLSELSADAAGLKICGNADAASSALRKALPGSTPGLSERIRSLDNISEAENYYNQLITRFSEKYPAIYTDFLEMTIIFISRLDGDLDIEEEEFIINRLSRLRYLGNNPLYLNRRVELREIIEQGKKIAELFPDKTREIFLNLSALSLRDNRITKREYEVLNTIGCEAFGFSPKTIDSMFISVIRSSCFQPYDEL